ncbi:unnamed protein product [Cylicostephanus goldi]|uniref:Uncharacterized protein n=1 Tax=Cylicostephanus goldi TaxID=71465 RepID=A0A3P6S2S6_CYLGO|nr:unnamed protein product [Cylicostephanus goldi]
MKQAETAAQKKVDKINVKLSDSERERKVLKRENEELRKRIEELEIRLAAAEEIPTSLDALKGDDSDWTIRSEHDVIIGDLQERLYTIQRENEGLNKKIEELKKVIEEKDAIINQTTQSKDGHTFVIGGGHDAESLLQRIDDLEVRLREEQDERAKANTALAAYMSRYHKLEKKLHEANVSIDKSLKASNKEEVKATVSIYYPVINCSPSELRVAFGSFSP